jgi:cytoskeleton protein RodZ
MSAERSPGGFGTKLREARERKGVSLRHIANATKISLSALEALERNDISRLPGGIFSRAFVRSYAIEVGLDPDSMIQEFIAQFPHDSVTAGHPTSHPVEDNEALESDRRMASTFLRLLAVSVPIVGVVLYFGISGWYHAATAVPAAAPPIEAEPKAVATDIVTPALDAPPAATTLTPAVSAGLVVEIEASGPCWVNAIVDGTHVMERQLQRGERATFEIKREMQITAGDGAALHLTLNGAAAKPVGKAGQVVTLHLNPANFTEYLAKR